ncbi:MAG: cupin domain-containing protein [Hyphomicrobiales bacterium]|nr:cupin domain-containing protein [Hyphomicrobiales bacterium]
MSETPTATRPQPPAASGTDGAECRIIRGGNGGFHGKQGLDYFAGVSAESAGSKALCMHLLEISPGGEAKPHYHEAHESAVYVLKGSAAMRHGPHLEHVDHVTAGDFLYIPAGVPHQPFNPTDKPVRAVIACTDPNEQESVVLFGDSRID